jgi:two-component system, NtrC family, sensor kinase
MSTGQSEGLEIATRRKLAETYKMVSLGRLLAAVMHEINTPMGSLVSNNEVMLRSLEGLKRLLVDAKAASTAPPQRALDILETLATLSAVDKIACERIVAMVRSVRVISRENKMELATANLHALLEDMLKLAGSAFRQRITVEKDYSELPEIECYPQSLCQVFLNLLVNAGQAIEGEGRIKVLTRREDDRVHIAISDTGKGIRPEDSPKIFSCGFTTKPADEGTGLGLAITHDIVVKDHRGTIDFESQAGAGTTFHVRLPITQARKNGN